VLNVAVAISAGEGALVSAVPSLLPYTLALCLGILDDPGIGSKNDGINLFFDIG
jgi:hypothetical protein